MTQVWLRHCVEPNPGDATGTRYDRDAILTCARKPTRVGLIYRTEPTTKNCKTEKLKVKTDMLEVTVKSGV